MASTMAAAAAHSMPPFPLPAVPRVRPPPIPKGTPGPNTLPQPGRPPRNGLVWVDGRWAYPQSRSGQHKQEIVSKQLEKALQHEVHGMNIYAYKHMRTHQVVYSLTKNMDNNKILKQLLYHGKKTVPGALRRDVWRPYFSVHFSKTPAGALKGLRVFQELRELSALRQLSPPEEMTRATQQEVDNIKRGYEAVELRDKTTKKIPRTKLLVLPVAGKKLPKKWLARRLMNQAATSVADIAAILMRQTNPFEYRLAEITGNIKDVKAEGLTPQQQMARIAEARKTKEEELSIRNYSRLQEIRKKEEAKADQLEQRQGYLAPKPGMVKVDAHTKDRVSMEYDGIGQHLAMIEEADELTSQEIGAAQKLEYTLGNIESEKKRQRQQIEKSMGKEIKDRLMKMTQAERDQIEKDVEAERAEKQTEIDSKVAATREKYRQQRVKLYKRPATGARTRALRKLSRDSQAEVFALKTDLRTRHLKWAGPFAEIATAVDEAMLKIDEEWEEALIQLRQEVNQQQEKHAEPGNHEVEIRWANLRDGTHARSWPDTVFHTELQPKAVSKSMIRAATTQFHIDADEEHIETQVGLAEAPRRSTVHVFGSLAPDPAINTQAKGRYETPAQLLARQREERYRRIDEWRDTEVVLLREKIITMRSRRDELARVFARTEVDQEYTPYIYNAVLMIEGAAEKANDKLKGDAYKIDEVEDIIGDIEYVRQEYLPGCQGDLEYSANPIADEARIQWATLMTDLLVLEVRNPEARKQADIRNRFFGLFNEREILEDSIERFRDDPKLSSKAQREKDEFDLNNPFIITILARREAALENLPAEIEDAKAEISRLEEEIKTASVDSEDIGDLQAQLSTEQADLHTREVELAKVQREEAGGRDVIRESIRQDKQAWLDYKQEQGGVSYGGRSDYFESSRSGVAGGVPSVEGESRSQSNAAKDGRGMVMENPADVAEEGKKKGLFARLFGRGK